jgi:transketolase
VKKTKERLGMDPNVFFDVPADVAAAFRGAAARTEREAWEHRLAEHPLAQKFRGWHMPAWDRIVERIVWPAFDPAKGVATRKANAACVKAIIAEAPFLIGGSADLHESNGLAIGRPSLTRERFAGTGDIHFGVREHAMGAISNGIVLHGGVRPYCATFLVFHDYQRPSVRLSALMGAPVIYLYSHDSILLGEDGPTHQPIDTLLALRAIPGIEVWRPADATETVECWKAALTHTTGPSSIILTRQDLPVLQGTGLVHRGGYVLADVDDPQVVLIGTGSEVPLCLEAQKVLGEKGVRARVVSFPCRERFSAQDLAYRTSVLPVGVPRVAVEAAATLGWERWVGEDSAIVGIDHFGASAPIKVLAKEFGFTADRVAAVAAGLVR